MFPRLIAFLLVMALIPAGLYSMAAAEEAAPLYVRKVENLPEDFIMGMDASSVIAEEDSGVKYYDWDGNEADVFRVLAESGINMIRVRVWNDPYDDEGHGFGGGNCDIRKALLIGQRATKYGMKLLVDFHYSDFWADPAKQMVPRAWQGMETEDKAVAAYEFTRDCLQLLKDGGVDVGMVQMGNETNGKLCGEKNWIRIQAIMQAGAKATREVYPDALVALHFANPEKADSYATYAKKMDYYKVDYDVFASSYYPYWHGTLDNLAAVLSDVAETYGKKVMVMETSYAYTPDDTDFNGNTISDGTAVKPYPFTVQGQANCVADIIDTVANKTTNGIGVCYWEGTWISVGGASWEENSALWEQFGSGWASKYAAVYDPDDAGKYWGGCAVDNQALFDATGHPLPSLKVFSLVREGSDAPVKPDAPETESEPDKAPRQAPADALMVTVQDETGVRDRVFHLIDSSGQYLRAAAMNRLGQCVLELSPGQSYTLAAPDGVEVSFFLEDNASISAVSGSGWTDGELLHVDTEIRCSLTLLRTAGQEPLVYTLTGGTYAESRALYCPEGETMGSALFTGMPPGRYTLTCNDGSTRTVELTAGTPDVTLGLD